MDALVHDVLFTRRVDLRDCSTPVVALQRANPIVQTPRHNGRGGRRQRGGALAASSPLAAFNLAMSVPRLSTSAFQSLIVLPERTQSISPVPVAEIPTVAWSRRMIAAQVVTQRERPQRSERGGGVRLQVHV